MNAYMVWAGQQVPMTEEGQQAWRTFLAYIDHPPSGVPPRG